MKKATAFLIAAVMAFSVYFGSATVSNAGSTSETPAIQIVPKTKQVSRRVYQKGRWVTVTTWVNGKRVTKKVYQKGRWVTVTTWRGGKRITKKVWRKGRNIVMGPSRRTP